MNITAIEATELRLADTAGAYDQLARLIIDSTRPFHTNGALIDLAWSTLTDRIQAHIDHIDAASSTLDPAIRARLANQLDTVQRSHQIAAAEVESHAEHFSWPAVESLEQAALVLASAAKVAAGSLVAL